MATLIQSKQIQGIVSASNIAGDFTVGGNIQAPEGTASLGQAIVGSISSSGPILGVRYDDIDGSPDIIAGTNITVAKDGSNFIISSSATGDADVDSLNSFTSSYFVQSSSFDSRINELSISGSGSFNGDRVVTNENLPSGIYNANFETTTTVQEFLNAVFFPSTGNNAPSISTGNQTIEEFESNGATITTISATDADGDSLTFNTGSSYTDDLVRVASNGVMTLNAVPTSASFNTDLVSAGVHGHLVPITANDGTDTTSKNIYIIVTPNEAPVFRETSVSGNVITSVTVNLNENSVDDTLVKRVYFTDAESDTITIHSSSIDNNHFEVIKYATYVDILQNTSSLDYEQQTSYTFSISASDEHYPSQDSNAITELPITVNVTDNLSPTINNQTLSAINENSANGATVGTLTAADNESDSISFVTFDLYKLFLDSSEVTQGTYGGTSQTTDPHENPFQMDSSGVVTRKTGIYLNSDLIDSYQYQVKVKDNFNALISSASVITIPIDDDTPATLTDNWSAGPYIKESELNSATIKTTDYGSTQAAYTSDQTGTWSSSNPAIVINSSGQLSMGVQLNGSVTQSGETIDTTITFVSDFGSTTTDSISVSVVANDAPTATFTNQTDNFLDNLATTGTTMVSMSITDTEDDVPYDVTLGGTDASSLELSFANSDSSSVGIQASTNLSVKTYSYDITIVDNYSKSTTYSNQTFTIAENDAPVASFTDQSSNYETDNAVTDASMVSVTITDTENDVPFDVVLSGTDASSLKMTFGNSNSSSLDIEAATNLSAATYNYTLTVTDTAGKSNAYSRSFTISESAAQPIVYIYRSNYGSEAGLSGNYNALMGASTVTSDTPPEVSAYTANSLSPYRLISSSLGDDTMTLAGSKTMTKVATLSGSNFDTIISESNPFTMGASAEQYIIIAPAGSTMTGIPTSMTDGFGDNTEGRYVFALKGDGGLWGAEPSVIHLIDTVGSINGYDKHFVIGRSGQNAVTSAEIRIIPASGSLPS
jgi:hypothetical protein